MEISFSKSIIGRPKLKHSEQRVLQILRRMGSGSKADIARAADLTGTAIGTIVNSLKKKNLILSGKKERKGHRGQPATMLHLNPTGAYGIGVRIERTSIQTVLIDFDGNILSRFTNEILLPHPERALEIVYNDICSLLDTLDDKAKSSLTGIGLAQPYNLGSWLKELGLPVDRFKAWDTFNFGSKLSAKTHIPVHVENDGTAAAIAELFYGVGREIDDFLYVFFGAAIGGGLVLNGDIIRGVSANAADIGLIPTPPSPLSTALKPDGKWDILLNRASLNSLRRHLKKNISGCEPELRSNLEQLIKDHSKDFTQWLDDCVEAVAPVIMSAKALLDVQTIVIAANIEAGFTSQIISALQKELNNITPESRFPPQLVSGTFRSNAGAVGAASLPIFYNFSPRNKS